MDHDEDIDQLRAAIAKLARQLNLGATQAGLTPSQASALGLISGNGPLGVAELAELEQVNPSMVSRIVGKLVAAELIERSPGPDDGRTALVGVTARGRSLVKEIKRSRTAELRRALSTLTVGERGTLAQAVPTLIRLAAALREQVDGPVDLRQGARPVPRP